MTSAQIADEFELRRTHAQFTIASSVGDHDRPDIALKAQQVHGRCYVDFGYFDESGLTGDGRLVPELDGTRDDDTKVIASYLLAYPTGTSIAEAGATIRLLDVGPTGTIDDLPTYKYFADTFRPHVTAKLHDLADRHATRGVREIAALATDSRNHAGAYELMRAIIQNSMINEQLYGQRELYIAALTKNSLGPVVEFVGESAVETLSAPVQIFSDDPRSQSIYVTPMLIDCARVVHHLKDKVRSAGEDRRLRFLTDGLPDAVA